ncbi:MAG: hypothetical protein JRJ87_16505 [Deltaproteobacteria bacterium]|nr:hypothetical protein [Deltaproteobacteria bacterium]
METYAEVKPLIDDPQFIHKRDEALSKLDQAVIDAPIAGLIKEIADLPHCFTLQSCWGHFVHAGQKDINGLEPLADYKNSQEIEYRIAYIAFCIQNSQNGLKLYDDLRKVTEIDPDNIQFCSANWFWQQRVNTVALQVEPDRFKDQDTAMIGVEEALYLEKLKPKMFGEVERIIKI